MHRIALLTTTAALLGVPAAAQAASGVVLSANGHAHSLQVVDSSHHLHSLHYRGHVAHLRPGVRVSYSGGSVARHLKVAGHGSASTTFTGRVVRASGHTLVLLIGGRKVRFTVAHGKLTPGETVELTETVTAHGHVSVKITGTSPATGTKSSGAGGSDSSGQDSSSSPDSSGGTDGPQDVTGKITAVSPSALTLATASGAQNFVVDDPTITDGFSVGDQVDVTYQDLGDSSPDAINVQWIQQTATGVVSAVDDGDLSLTPSAGGQPLTFTEDPSDGDFVGVLTGDTVQVTYHLQDGQVVVDQVDDQTTDAGGGSDS
jgi:hypothetical protein